ncbi:MAG: hypothetical protein QM733_10895 [Ilumatobacteraceae bacterium]
MALYVSARTRRTRAVIAAVVVGLLAFGLGWLIGRQQVPSVNDRVAAVQDDADAVATGLERLDVEYAKVLAGTDSLDAAVLAPIDQTVTRAQHALDDAPWITSAQRARCSPRARPDPRLGGGQGPAGHLRRPPHGHRRARPRDVRGADVAADEA